MILSDVARESFNEYLESIFNQVTTFTDDLVELIVSEESSLAASYFSGRGL